MEWAFWVSFIFIVLTYGGYPLGLYIRSRFRPRRVCRIPVVRGVSIIMAVRNEARGLPSKLRNLDELDYPRDWYEIIVVSDGSYDNTNQILAGWAGERRRALVCEEHEGKAAALNRGIKAASGEIVIFTDARQLIAPDAVDHLVANFSDSSVGCVSGDVALGDSGANSSINGLGLYWRIESTLRRWEGATGSLVGAAGCLYAVRKDLLVTLPAGTILDDVYLPLHVARRGAQVVFEPRARGWDHVQSDPRHEFRRKVRTLLGNFQLLKLVPWVVTRANPLRFEFVCHKLLRLLVPFALVVLLVASVSLRGRIYDFALTVQLMGYFLAGLAMSRVRLGILSRLADISLAFAMLNAAVVVALIYFVVGRRPAWGR